MKSNLFSTSILLCSQMIPTIVQAEEIYETNTVENILSYAGLDIKEEVKNLFEDNEETKIKSIVRQSEINDLQSKIINLPDSEEKKKLLEKIELATSLLQEFVMKGYDNRQFVQLDFTNENLTIRTENIRPHGGFYDQVYASLVITRKDATIVNKKYIGNKYLSCSQEEISLQNGDLVTITHREANDIRFTVNHTELKPNRNGIYKYIVHNGLLVEINKEIQNLQNQVNNLFDTDILKKSVTQEMITNLQQSVSFLPGSQEKTNMLEKLAKAQEQYNERKEINTVKTEVKTLFKNNEETELKETVQGSDIDNIKQKIYKLKDSEEKQQLLEKIALAMSLLQEIIMKGYSNVEFAKLDFTKYRMVLRTRPVQPHWGGYSDVYASVKVARDDKTIFEKNYVANVTQKNLKKKFD